MANLRRIQTNLTSGELDPGLAAREDVAFYFSGAQRLENVVPQPQGGGVGRGGWEGIDTARGVLSELDISSATVTAPLGSGAANGIDGDETTEVTLGVFAAPDEVVYTLDYGSVPAGLQVAIDLILINVTVAETQVFEAQYSTDDISYTTAGTVSVNSVTPFSVRIASVPGVNFGSPRYWRIRRSSGTVAGALFAELRIHTEGAQSEVLATPFTFSNALEYCVVLTGGNADIYLDSTKAFVAAVAIPHTDAQIDQITWAQSLDTMILFHNGVHPWRLFRLGSNDRWDFRKQPFDSVQRYPWGDSTVSMGVNEQQSITRTAGSTGDTYVLFLNGVATASITVDTVEAVHAANIEAALEGHEDITSVTVTSPANNDFIVEFDGVDGNRPFPVLAFEKRSGNVTLDTGRVQRGREETAPLWDDNHGFPATGTFYQGRFYMGGFRDQPDIIAGSRIGAFFTFDLDVDDAVADDSPMQFRADSNEQVTIVQIHSGRHLQVFTTSGEFYAPLEPIAPANISMKQTSRTGSESGVPVFDVEGGTFFVVQGGDSIREFLFVDTEQSYVPGSISLLAEHLVAQPRSVALRRARTRNDAALYYMANTGVDVSGVKVPAVAIATLRAQQVTAFFRITSRDDTFLTFAALQNGAVWTATKRELAAGFVTLIERSDSEYLLDSGLRHVNPDFDTFDADQAQTLFTYTFTSPATAAGVKVWTRAAGAVAWVAVDAADYTLDLGPKTVTFTIAPRLSRGAAVEVRINKRITSLALSPQVAHLAGEPVEIIVDRYPVHADKIDGGGANLATSADTITGHFADGGAMANDPVDILHPDNFSLISYIEDTSTGRHIFRIRKTATVTANAEVQVDVKPINDTASEQNCHIRINDLDIQTARFTLTGAGTVGVLGGQILTANIELIEDGWYRLKITTSGAITVDTMIAPNGGATYTGTGSDGYYITRMRLFTTPGTDSIDLLDHPADFEVHYGFGFTRLIDTMPDRGEDQQGPQYHVKKRIPEAHIQVRRTGDLEVGPKGRVISHVPGFFDSGDVPTVHIEAALLTGTEEIVGMRGWTVDANLRLRGKRNMDFDVLSIGYRVAT